MPQDGNPRRVSLVLPIILITIGALFLLHNWRPAFDPLPILATYWPLILIFVVLGLVLLLWHGRSFSRRHGFDSGEKHTAQTVDLQGAKSARAKLEMSAGQ